MKKVKIACVLCLFMLCSCSVKNNDTIDDNIETVSNVYDVGVIKSETENLTSMSSSTSTLNTDVIIETSNEYLYHTEISTESEISFEELAVIRLDEMMTAWINKDEAAWSEYFYGYDSSVSCFKDVDVESYSILDAKTYYDGIFNPFNSEDKQLFAIELNISQSDSKWFPAGKTNWNVLLGKSYSNPYWNERLDTMCWYFIPDNFNENDFYPYNNENKYADLGYVFSYSFNCFETVSDIREYCLAMDYESFLDGLKAFIRIDDEIVPQTVNEWGDPYYSKDDVNTIVSKYLGINDYSWDENFAGLGGDRLWKVWDMTTVYAVIAEQTDSYIDMVYFADYTYCTPAKKMRYYFIDNDGTAQLLGTQLLEDYGYEPNWEIN